MYREKELLVVCSLIFIILLISSVSAFSLGDWFKSVFTGRSTTTGFAVGGEVCTSTSQCGGLYTCVNNICIQLGIAPGYGCDTNHTCAGQFGYCDSGTCKINNVQANDYCDNNIYFCATGLNCSNARCVAPAVTCTYFTYSAWTACSDGVKTRTSTGYPAGCTGGTPEALSSTDGCSCTDSDSSYGFPGSYSVKGTATGQDVYPSSGQVTITDYCSGNKLYEAVCDSQHAGRVAWNYTSCSNGCSDGACLTQSASSAPGGWFDGFNSTHVAGWARDPDWQGVGQYIDVNIYIDGTSNTGKLIGSTSVNLPSEPAVGGNGNHRFIFAIPSGYLDGKEHSVYIYAVGKDSQGNKDGINALLQGSPVKVTFANSATCTDSDGGINYYVKGEFYSSISDVSAVDECLYSYTTNKYDLLAEYSCNDGSYPGPVGLLVIQHYQCSYGCSDGACINISRVYKLGEDAVVAENELVKIGDYVVSVGYISEDKVSLLINEEYTTPLIIGNSLKLSSGDYLVIKDILYSAKESAASKVLFTIQSTPPAPCSGLLNKVKNAQDFSDGYITYYKMWNNTYDTSLYINGKEESAKEYYAGWYTSYNDNNIYVYYDILALDNKEIDLSNYLADYFVSPDYCQVQDYWNANGETNKIYVCNWNAFNTETSAYKSESKEVLWAYNNLLIRIDVYSGRSLTDEEMAKVAQSTIQSLIQDIKDNKFKYVDQGFYIDYPASSLISNILGDCPSSIPSKTETCYASWSCRVEPAICPEHGQQKRVCIDRSGCNTQNKEETILCTPGICSGCIVPRWFGDDYYKKCIPYGFRFAQESGTHIELVTYEENYSLNPNEHGYILSVTSGTTATLSLVTDYDSNTGEYLYTNYSLVLGKTTEIEEDYGRVIRLTVNSISQEKGTVDVTISYESEQQVIDTFNAYCDIDGEVKMQKVKEKDGNSASCQNNYECDSNACSSGKCVEVNDLLAQSSAFRRTVAKILCRISSALTSDTYEDCLASFVSAD
jgi:hypothetical protein